MTTSGKRPNTHFSDMRSATAAGPIAYLRLLSSSRVVVGMMKVGPTPQIIPPESFAGDASVMTEVWPMPWVRSKLRLPSLPPADCRGLNVGLLVKLKTGRRIRFQSSVTGTGITGWKLVVHSPR